MNLSIFHTKVVTALTEGSTWAGIAAGITAAAAMPEPWNYITAVISVPAVVLRDRGAPPDGGPK